MARTHDNYQLGAEDREALEALFRSPKAAQSLIQRAHPINCCRSDPDEVAESLKTSVRAVYSWRNRFKDQGLAGLKDRQRPGQHKNIAGETVKEVLRLTVTCIPRESTHWSVRLMAKAAGVTAGKFSRSGKLPPLSHIGCRPLR